MRRTPKTKPGKRHISELYYYWYYFYQLRSLTLWDFERNMELEADFEDISKADAGRNYADLYDYKGNNKKMVQICMTCG